MKTLIYQYYYTLPQNERTHHIMSDDNQYHEYSRKSIQKYAESIGADYKFLGSKHPVSPFYGIFLPFSEGWCHDYDYICWVDADMLATKTARNIFDFAEQDKISAHFMNTQARWRGKGEFAWWADKGHINSGVVVWPRSVYEFVTDYTKDLRALHDSRGVLETSLGNFDQAIVNKIVRKLNSYKTLDDDMNYHLGRKPQDARFAQSLIHYWRKTKPMLITDFNDERILK